MMEGFLDQVQPGASDDEDDERMDLQFVLSGASSAGNCRSLVICGPGAASAFALEALSLQPLSWRFDPEDSSERVFPPAPKTPRFYEVSSSSSAVIVALLESAVPAEDAVAWSEALLGSFSDLSQVIVLDRKLRAEWVSVDRQLPEEPCLTGLWTSAWASAGSTLSPLPAPNLVEGLPAAVLSHCEALQQRCLVALALQDGAHLGEGCIRGFEVLVPLLKELKVVQDTWKKPDYREALRKVVSPSSMSIYA
mmetsp:Transcript_69242/g.122500  ORF Transcript_69242/g.122500 Transcript_69242/m.122500 type:complete len:251 (-) Transcript_69242:108-860(-)